MQFMLRRDIRQLLMNRITGHAVLDQLVLDQFHISGKRGVYQASGLLPGTPSIAVVTFMNARLSGASVMHRVIASVGVLK